MFKSPKQHHLLDRPKKEGKEHMKNDYIMPKTSRKEKHLTLELIM